MPCGGIDMYTDVSSGNCWHCNRIGAKHYCSEWDCMLHAECVIPFLATEEGKVVIEHGHRVAIWFGADPKPQGEKIDPSRSGTKQ